MATIDIIIIAVIWSLAAIALGVLIGYWIGTNTINSEAQIELMSLRRLKDRAEDENKVLKKEVERLDNLASKYQQSLAQYNGIK